MARLDYSHLPKKICLTKILVENTETIHQCIWVEVGVAKSFF